MIRRSHALDYSHRGRGPIRARIVKRREERRWLRDTKEETT
ncbi:MULTISPECIES: hypothetical protein [unclassified Streptomyces]